MEKKFISLVLPISLAFAIWIGALSFSLFSQNTTFFGVMFWLTALIISTLHGLFTDEILKNEKFTSFDKKIFHGFKNFVGSLIGFFALFWIISMIDKFGIYKVYAKFEFLREGFLLLIALAGITGYLPTLLFKIPDFILNKLK